MKVIVGSVITSLAIVWFGRKQTHFSERLYLSIVLFVIALIYVAFGLHDGDPKHLQEELIGLAIYGSLAAVGYRRSIWWLVVGIGGHALWDWAHKPDMLEGYTPSWYREYCILVDLMLAGYVIIEQPSSIPVH